MCLCVCVCVWGAGWSLLMEHGEGIAKYPTGREENQVKVAKKEANDRDREN